LTENVPPRSFAIIFHNVYVKDIATVNKRSINGDRLKVGREGGCGGAHQAEVTSNNQTLGHQEETTFFFFLSKQYIYFMSMLPQRRSSPTLIQRDPNNNINTN